MIGMKRAVAILSLTVGLNVAVGRADIVVAADGGLSNGKVVSQDAKEVVFQNEGADAGATPLRIPKTNVSKLLLTDEHGALLSDGGATTQPAPHWEVPSEPTAPPILPPGNGPTYCVIPMHGEVGVTILARALEKSLDDAIARKPTVVVLDIDSPGGLVAESEKIADVLHHYNKKARIVAFTAQDLSAAAIFSLSVREIYVKPSSTIGAATSYIPGNLMLPPKIEEKMQSAWRAAARNSAEEGRHEPLLADAMIDDGTELHLETSGGKPVVKEGPGDHTLCRKGKILTLSSHEAVECGLAAGEADDVAELGTVLKLANWKEIKGIGAPLADSLVARAKAFDAEQEKIHARFLQNLQGAINSDPSQSVTTVTHVVPQQPGFPGNPRMTPQIPGRRVPFRPQPPGPPQTYTVTHSRSHKLWKFDSLTCVMALQQCELNIKEASSLSQAFGRSSDVELLAEAQEKLGTIRSAIYDGRNKYGQAIVVARSNAGVPQGSVQVPNSAGPGNRAEQPAFGMSLPADASKTDMLGGNGGSPFVMTDPSERPVIGFRYTLGSWGGKPCLRQFQPLFEKPAAPESNQTDIVARDGYVVAGLEVENDVTNILAVQITFVRWKDGKLVAADSYKSDWIGEQAAGPTRTLAGKGETVIGVFGHRGMNLDAMGLVVKGGGASQATGVSAPAVPAQAPVPASPVPTVPKPVPVAGKPPAGAGNGRPDAGARAPLPTGKVSGLELLDERSLEGNGSLGTLTFSPDGTMLAAGGFRIIRIWDMTDKDLKPLATQDHAHASDVRVLRFSPDAKLLVSGSYDKDAKLWNVEKSGLSERATLKGHESGVQSAAFSPDGKVLATGSDDATVFFWGLAGSDRPKELDAIKDGMAGMGVLSLAYTPNGRAIALATGGGRIAIWDVTGARPAQRFNLTNSGPWVQSVVFSPDGQTMASGGWDKHVRLWSLKGAPTLSKMLDGHDDKVLSLSFSPDGRYLASSGADGQVIVWDPASGTELFHKQRSSSFNSIAFRPKLSNPGELELAAGSSNGTIFIYRLGAAK